MGNLEIYIDDRQDIEIAEEIIFSIKNAIKKVLLFENMDSDYEVSLSFVANEEIKELNYKFRGVDKATDVLSFPMVDDFLLSLGEVMLGDIIISVEKAEKQAKEFGHDFKREMVYLTVHSMLHLLGYDHSEENEKKEMRLKEEEIMNELDIKR